VADILGAVDLTHVIHVTPGQAGSQPADLMLPSDRWQEQQAGGTWSQLFDTQSPINRYQLLTVLVWYLSLGLLGLLVYPLVRLALPGLADKGYPVTRIVGLLLLAYLVWVADRWACHFLASPLLWYSLASLWRAWWRLIGNVRNYCRNGVPGDWNF
jgi:hypothetical protein